MGEHDGPQVGEALVQVVVLEVLIGRPHVHPQPLGAFVGGAGAGRERLGGRCGQRPIG
jgi:hypothetical protein